MYRNPPRWLSRAFPRWTQRGSLRRAASLAGEMLFPPVCAGCGRYGDWVCHECERAIRRAGIGGCGRCGRPGPVAPACEHCLGVLPTGLRQVRAVWAYQRPIRESIHRFKYMGEFERGRDLGRRMAEHAPTLVGAQRLVDAVVAVPLHPRRYRERGFNQAAVLASQVAPALGCEVVPAVERTRYTVSQTGLDNAARIENMRGAFAVARDAPDFAGATVLVVDDVVTTGATIGAVAAALLEAGVGEVVALAAAR
jgi:ComF family protein